MALRTTIEMANKPSPKTTRDADSEDPTCVPSPVAPESVTSEAETATAEIVAMFNMTINRNGGSGSRSV